MFGQKLRGIKSKILVNSIKKVNCRASYVNPYQPSEGIECVIIDRRIVFEKGEYNANVFAGKVLKRT